MVVISHLDLSRNSIWKKANEEDIEGKPDIWIRYRIEAMTLWRYIEADNLIKWCAMP